MRFKAPLSDRLAASRYRKGRYSSDPQFRLYYVNASRAQRGLPPLVSADALRDRSDAARQRKHQRDSLGRFA